MSGSLDSSNRDPIDPDADRDPVADEEAIRVAKGMVFIPAVGLIATGAFMVILAILGFIQLPKIGAQFDEVIKQVEADPNAPAQEKKDKVEFITKIRDIVLTYGPVVYGVAAFLGLVVLVGGIRFVSLNNPGVVVLAALGSMLPVSACCLLGLVFGIWSLVVLMQPAVKAGYAARRRSGYGSDEPRG